jgi:hypothetical protein
MRALYPTQQLPPQVLHRSVYGIKPHGYVGTTPSSPITREKNDDRLFVGNRLRKRLFFNVDKRYVKEL